MTALPDTRMLYYPLPTMLTEASDTIYALMATDNESTMLFGKTESDPDKVYICLQSSTDMMISFQDKDGWFRSVKTAQGVHVITKDEARALWQELIKPSRSWTSIPTAA